MAEYSNLVDKRQEIYEACYIDFYVATQKLMLDYPYLLATPYETSPAIVDKFDRHIMDSHIGNGEITTEEVLDRAIYLDATNIVPIDVIGEPEQTIENTVECFVEAEARGYDGDILVPLQCDDNYTYVQNYQHVRDRLRDRGFSIDGRRLGVGGVMRLPYVEQFRRVAKVREHVGDAHRIHGFGFGVNTQWVKIIRRCPWLLDSIDSSGPVREVINGKMFDMNFRSIDFEIPRGRHSTALMMHGVQYILMILNHMMSPLPRDGEINDQFDDPELAIAVARHEQRYS